MTDTTTNIHRVEGIVAERPIKLYSTGGKVFYSRSVSVKHNGRETEIILYADHVENLLVFNEGDMPKLYDERPSLHEESDE